MNENTTTTRELIVEASIAEASVPRGRAAVLCGAAVALCVVAAVLAGCGSPGQGGDQSATLSGAPAQQWTPGADDPGSSITATVAPSAVPPSPQATLPAYAAGVNRGDPAAVAAMAVRIWFTWNTGTDRSPSDAVARAAPLLSPAFRSQVLSDQALTPDGQWLVWSSRSAVVTPTVVVGPNQGAPDRPDRKYFVFAVTQTGRDASGTQVGGSVQSQAWVITTRTDTGWEVSQLQQR
ncbi:hypothetical protein [Gordonia sp. N1V]|uniref:hypothetical protein n=1 Tax=Gordonia sp. N1V TaxID=3034163 RepID=UPI0023E20675|nr:hypothetical protein [Gordonia sp. N1V]MDF3285038.1 hypothetical protein [Gordonia sp. N1V]